MKSLFVAVASVALLSACNQAADSNQALAEANSSGNEAAAAVENAVDQSGATPLEREQALALMKERHENYEKIGKASRAAKKGLETSDLATVRSSAATINELAHKVSTSFPAGTGPDVGKTMAKAAIWEQRDKFDDGMKNFQSAAAAFQQAAQGNDVAAMKAAHAKLGGTCKACHESFREEND
ncbi:MAG: c-type cytochrome [Sphingomicrobium sp.]